MNTLALVGCRSTPLAGYLKALGVLRVLSLQSDPEIRGMWRNGRFSLQGSISHEKLTSFFLERYSPTPLVAPWNGGGGFSPKNDTTTIDKILKCEDPRFRRYAETIREIRKWPEVRSIPESVGELAAFLTNQIAGKSGKAAESTLKLLNDIRSLPEGIEDGAFSLEKTALKEYLLSENREEIFKKSAAWRKSLSKALTEYGKIQRSLDKEAIMNACRTRLPDDLLDWFDAVYALAGDKTSFAPILATGANDGNFEFSSTFMKRTIDVLLDFPRERSARLLESSLFDTPAEGLMQGKIGFYDPGRAGGYNQGNGVEQKDFSINPWDYVLLFEGLPVLAASVSRRAGRSGAFIAAPFTVRHTRAGYVSAGDEKDRSETWLPVWENPALFEEVRFLFREGRSALKRRASRTGLDFARAAGSLGVDRGIRFFQRYIYLERRGKSYVALPAGAVATSQRPEIEILNEVDPVIRGVDTFLREFGANIPASFATARRRIEDCLFACATSPSPDAFRKLVRSFGGMERLIAQRADDKAKAHSKPFFGLSARWVALCDENGRTPEVRLAASLASVRSSGEVGPLRSYLSGVDPANPREWGKNCGSFWQGVTLEERLCRLLIRRQMDAGRSRSEKFPLESFLVLEPEEVVPFLEKETDDVLLEELLRGFLWIDWKKKGLETPKDRDGFGRERPLSRTWALLKLCHTPYSLQGETLPFDPRIAALLFAQRTDEATRAARNRLRISGFPPRPVAFASETEPRRLLASMLFPTGSLRRIARLVLMKDFFQDIAH